MTNSCREIIEKARRLVGAGSIKYSQPKGNRKPVYVLNVHAQGIRRVLPHLNLIAKKEQKILCLEALSLLEGFGKGSRKGFHGGKMRPLWKDERFAEIKRQMNILNRRGRAKANPLSLVNTHVE